MLTEVGFQILADLVWHSLWMRKCRVYLVRVVFLFLVILNVPLQFVDLDGSEVAAFKGAGLLLVLVLGTHVRLEGGVVEGGEVAPDAKKGNLEVLHVQVDQHHAQTLFRQGLSANLASVKSSKRG